MNQFSRLAESTDPRWFPDAACRGVDPTLFHPRRGENDNIDAARAICAECPVRDDCLEYALERRERHGVWGGRSENERRRIRSERARVARQAARP